MITCIASSIHLLFNQNLILLLIIYHEIKDALEVEPWKRSGRMGRLIRNIEKTISDRFNVTDWEKVCFCNFVQILLNNQYDRPSYHDYCIGVDTLIKVLYIIEPNFVLFAGVKAIDSLHEMGKSHGLVFSEYRKGNSKINGTFPRVGKFELESNLISFVGLKHPSKY